MSQLRKAIENPPQPRASALLHGPRLEFFGQQELFPRWFRLLPRATRRAVVTSQYRQLARDFHLMARNLPPGEERTALLKMAEEYDRLADQQEHASNRADKDDTYPRKGPREGHRP